MNLTDKKYLPIIGGVTWVGLSYGVLVCMIEWLRTRAGVAPDTATPIDIIAWLGSIYVAAMIAGIVADRVIRCAGLGGIIALFMVLVSGVLIHSDASLALVGFFAMFGVLAYPVLGWTMLLGVTVGWRCGALRHGFSFVGSILMILVSSLITLILVYYPADCYFMKSFG
jgi:hypothetical protein